MHLRATGPLRYRSKHAGCYIFAYLIRRKRLTVHGNIHPRRERLGKGDRTAEVKQRVRLYAYAVGDHCASQYYGLRACLCCTLQILCRFGHRVGAVGDCYAVVVSLVDGLADLFAMLIGHIEAVDHVYGFDRVFAVEAGPGEHFG